MVCVSVCMGKGTLRVMGVFIIPSGFYQVITLVSTLPSNGLFFLVCFSNMPAFSQ